jgi:hypothetical protein
LAELRAVYPSHIDKLRRNHLSLALVRVPAFQVQADNGGQDRAGVISTATVPAIIAAIVVSPPSSTAAASNPAQTSALLAIQAKSPSAISVSPAAQRPCTTTWRRLSATTEGGRGHRLESLNRRNRRRRERGARGIVGMASQCVTLTALDWSLFQNRVIANQDLQPPENLRFRAKSGYPLHTAGCRRSGISGHKR